jgi:hypothetical protein
LIALIGQKTREAMTPDAGLEFSTHDLRRTYVTVAESCDISHFALKGLINLSIGAGVTEGYIDMQPERLSEPAQKVADKLKRLCGITADPVGETVRKLR